MMPMVEKIFTVLGSFLIVVPLGVARAQVEFSRTAKPPAINFYFDAITFIADVPGKSRLDVYVQVPHDELHFVKVGEEYITTYETSVQLLDGDQRTIEQRSWKADDRTRDFNQTSSSKYFSLTHQTLDISPGKYEIDVEVFEPETQKRTTQKKSILITDFGKDDLALSDIMLINRLTQAGDKTVITPNVSGVFSRQAEGFYLFFEAYHVSSVDSLSLLCRILDAKKKEMWQKEQVQPPGESKMQIFVRVDSTNFDAGTYLVVIEGLNARQGTTLGLKATTSRPFTVRWSDIPPMITNIDKAIDQMKYIARESELDSIRNGKELQERRKRFLEFWAKRDPDPSTPRNELMEEYYRRVDFANKSFTRFMEGWRTDMGMVYIRLGPPENIERHPFEMGTKPYEIWYYYQLDREVIFVDYSGFGDYRMQNPTDDIFRGLR
jgi:GWxTD domain-containing protein